MKFSGFRSIAIAGVTVVALAGATGVADAAPKQVTEGQLPSVGQAASIVPELAGGQFQSVNTRDLSTPKSNCKASVTKTATGRSAAYLPKLKAGEQWQEALLKRGATVQTVRFSSPKKAKSWLTSVSKAAKKCAGKGRDGSSLKVLKSKKVGAQRLTVFSSVPKVYAGVASRSTTVMARSGNTLTVVNVQGPTKKPRVKAASSLAKLALKKAK